MNTVVKLPTLAEVQHQFPEPVFVFSTDPDLMAQIRSSCPEAVIEDGMMESAIEHASTNTTKGCYLVDIAGQDPARSLQNIRSLCAFTPNVAVVGEINDVAFSRRVIRAGARDYLVKPTTIEVLAEAIMQASSSETTQQESSKCRTIYVTGPGGGSGVSSFIAGAAWHLSEKCNLKVALIDLDLSFGTIALSFDLEPSHGLREILENPDRVDSLFIGSATAKLTERLSILAAEEELENPPTIQPRALNLLIDELSSSFDCILVDLPSGVLSSNPELLSRADHLAVVSSMNLAAIRDVLRLRNLNETIGAERALSVIANLPSRRDVTELTEKEFAKGLQMSVLHTLPRDSKSLAEAAKAGQAVTDAVPNCDLSKSIGNIAIELSDRPELCDSGLSIWKRLSKGRRQGA
jgi:pilus assembly protein CpaE